MPIPWSTTTISTTPSLSRTVVPTPIRVPASEYATALSSRLRTTVTSRSWSPSTTAGSPPTSMVMSLAVVLGDHDLLVTVVRNLLDNAVAYSEAGTRIGVGTTVRDKEGVVEIVVVDQGIGIPAEALSRLFERFYRVDPARSRDTGGTGPDPPGRSVR